MTKELDKYSTNELITELWHRDHVAMCVFVKEDIVEGLRDNDVIQTEEAIDSVFGWKIGDAMCECGWEVIKCAAEEYKWKKRQQTITAQDVRAGFKSGLVRLTDDGTGDVACEIGFGESKNWFWFGGEEAEGVTVDEYLRDIPMDTIIDEVVAALKGFQQDDPDEWMFYRQMLDEHNDKED